MRCMACGEEEMRPAEGVPAQTKMVPGFAHYALQCPGCNFLYVMLQPNAGALPDKHDTPRVASSTATQRVATSSAKRSAISRSSETALSGWDRSVKKRRERWRALCGRLGLQVSGEREASEE
jgi:hypothetical protein